MQSIIHLMLFTSCILIYNVILLFIEIVLFFFKLIHTDLCPDGLLLNTRSLLTSYLC